MNNTELFRRGVVVPLNSDVEKSLFNNDVSEGILVKQYIYPDDTAFYSLYNYDFFDYINNEIGTMLDDYEEEVVNANNLPLLIGAINDFLKSKHIDGETIGFVKRILEICYYANDNHRPIFFFL